MRELQRGSQARGHDVGAIDGILGAGTRAAVRQEQRRLGLPADAWPTFELLNAL
jgi:peptidoglycan hydrolase-like protein with peptidoglycan-binding domain